MTSTQVKPSDGAQRAGEVEELDVLVVGAGFSGLYQLTHLRELGYSVKVYEAAPSLGGIWYWNCYPGARTDTHAPLYQFGFGDLWKDWNFSELYPSWKELRAYFDYVDRKLDLSRDIRFSTWVTEAEFDEERHHWVVRTRDGRTAHARYLVMCTGIGAKPHLPEIKGLEDFAGEVHHPARWPQDGVDLSGKRVGVIGTGATGVQVIQASAAVASHVTVFQRTPCTALPMHQRKLDSEDWAKLKLYAREMYAKRAQMRSGFEYTHLGQSSAAYPPDELLAIYEDLWAQGGFRLSNGSFRDIVVDKEVNDVVYAFWRDKVRARISDPAVAEKLAPTESLNPWGTKRIPLEQNYYDVFNQDNVELVDLRESPIERVTATGVVTADGVEHELDILVPATGYDSVTGGLTAIDMRGAERQSLRDKWQNGVDAYLGTATHGFPNMVFLYGPLAPSAFANGPSASELQGEEVVGLIRYMQDNGHTRFESSDQADKAWRAEVDEITAKTLLGRADSWYMGANIPGKARQMLNYPGGIPTYLEKWAESKSAGYAGFEIT
jgi:cyclohexanone monooxygenase